MRTMLPAPGTRSPSAYAPWPPVVSCSTVADERPTAAATWVAIRRSGSDVAGGIPSSATGVPAVGGASGTQLEQKMLRSAMAAPDLERVGALAGAREPEAARAGAGSSAADASPTASIMSAMARTPNSRHTANAPMRTRRW